MKGSVLTLVALGAGLAGAAGVEVKECPKCERYARYADDGKSASVNRARFEGTAAEKDAAGAPRRCSPRPCCRTLRSVR